MAGRGAFSPFSLSFAFAFSFDSATNPLTFFQYVFDSLFSSEESLVPETCLVRRKISTPTTRITRKTITIVKDDPFAPGSSSPPALGLNLIDMLNTSGVPEAVEPGHPVRVRPAATSPWVSRGM
jgi:hypothetical protein